jgi:hypothetical protein
MQDLLPELNVRILVTASTWRTAFGCISAALVCRGWRDAVSTEALAAFCDVFVQHNNGSCKCRCGVFYL